jgi:hypothetical protein
MPHVSVPTPNDAGEFSPSETSLAAASDVSHAMAVHDGAEALPLTPADAVALDLDESLHRNALPRAHGVWREWLETLARDPEAAYAAALAYRQLEPGERDQWLLALERDAALVAVPRIAVYAPLLAVESDRERRGRMESAMRACPYTEQEFPPTELVAGSLTRRAFYGVATNGMRVAVLVGPLYLDFVQVLACGYFTGQRFVWVRHDPIARGDQVVCSGAIVDGVCLTPEPFDSVIDELARTVLAQQRAKLPLPEALSVFADWFGPSLSNEP